MKKLIVFLFVSIFVPSLCVAEDVYFYHSDAAGTPLAMTNGSGAVVWTGDYKPFGEESAISGSVENTKRFVGKDKDETGLSYFGARYEDAKTGSVLPQSEMDSQAA